MIIDVTKKMLVLLDKKRKCQAVILAVMMLAGGIMESLSVSMILPLVTAVMDKESWKETWYGQRIVEWFHISSHQAYIEVLLILLIVLFMVKNLYLLFEYYVQYTFTSRNRWRLQSKLMYQYMHLPYIYYIKSSTGEIVRNVTGDTNQAFLLLTNLLTFYTEIFVSMILAVTMFIISPGVSIGLVLILVIQMLVIYKVLKPVMMRMGDKQRHENALCNQWILQAIGGMKSIKVSRTEKFFYDKFSTHALQHVEIERKNQTVSNVPRLMIEAVTVSFTLGMILVMVINGVDIAAVVPLISAFLVAAIRLLPSVNRISMAMGQISFLKGGLDHVLEKMDKNFDLTMEWKEHTVPAASFQKVLELRDVTFSYPQSDKRILDSACMSVQSGHTVGIIGASGSGKTTLADILLGLLKPDKGGVYADDVNIEENLDRWLCRLAYIPQQIFLTDGTIRDNVAFGMAGKDIDDTKVWKALHEAQLDGFVKELPEKLDAKVGEAGVKLSGGQRQRIGIARALYHEPDILFFDEATSALDEATEAAVMESVDHLKGKKTVILITHRLGTLKGCDEIYKVEAGKIIRER